MFKFVHLGLLLLVALGFSISALAGPMKVKYSTSNRTFELNATTKKGAGSYGVNIHYSVKVGGKTLGNWEHETKFILKTCSDHGHPSNYAAIASDGKSDLGFLLFGGCGNPSQQQFDFVYVNQSLEVMIISGHSKDLPLFKATENPDIKEMWTVQQMSPNGVGTAMSFFVPNLHKFSLSGTSLSMDQQRPPQKISSWPAFEYVRGFKSFFAAGLTMMDESTMRQALDLYFDPQNAKDNAELGLPTTKEDALKVIESVKVLRDYQKNYPPRFG